MKKFRVLSRRPPIVLGTLGRLLGKASSELLFMYIVLVLIKVCLCWDTLDLHWIVDAGIAGSMMKMLIHALWCIIWKRQQQKLQSFIYPSVFLSLTLSRIESRKNFFTSLGFYDITSYIWSFVYQSETNMKGFELWQIHAFLHCFYH